MLASTVNLSYSTVVQRHPRFVCFRLSVDRDRFAFLVIRRGLNEKPKVCTQRAELGTKTGPSSNNVLKNFPNPSKIVDRKLSVSFGTLTMHAH